MKNFLFVIFALLGIHSNMVAQSIKGKIVDPEGQAIAFANVILCNDADSIMVSGCTSNLEGVFTLDCPKKENKHIKVSKLFYRRQKILLGYLA